MLIHSKIINIEGISLIAEMQAVRMKKRIGAIIIAVITFLAGAPLWVSIVLPVIYVVAAASSQQKTEENYDQYKGAFMGIGLIAIAFARRLETQLLWMAMTA